eukprot:04040.XXX_157936_158043_1 [CDS] Oithona nana genome sequencing.
MLITIGIKSIITRTNSQKSSWRPCGEVKILSQTRT